MSANLKKSWGANPACWHRPEHNGWVPHLPLPPAPCTLRKGVIEQGPSLNLRGILERVVCWPHPWRLRDTAFFLGVISLCFHSCYLICILQFLIVLNFLRFLTEDIYYFRLELRLFYPQRINNCFY